jgi:PDZ and LIM domain protein 5/6/7
MMPKTMSLKTSAVFQRLNEEAIKTRHDLEEETKKWTTFLQKPDRPATKPKQIEDPNRAEPYRVKIVKQPKPRIAPDREPTPPPREPVSGFFHPTILHSTFLIKMCAL